MKRIIVIMLALSLLFLAGCAKEKTCSTNEDCKLIYNNCGCEAVSIEDSRTKLEDDGRRCEINMCLLADKVTAVCFQGTCISQQPTQTSGGEPSPSTVYTNSYEGEPKVGNEILVKFIIEPYIDHPDNPFYTIDWDNISSIKSYEAIENEPYTLAPDLFEINYSGIEILKEEKKVTVNVPVVIQRDGKGFVQLRRGGKVWIETEGYIPPVKPTTDSDFVEGEIS